MIVAFRPSEGIGRIYANIEITLHQRQQLKEAGFEVTGLDRFDNTAKYRLVYFFSIKTKTHKLQKLLVDVFNCEMTFAGY